MLFMVWLTPLHSGNRTTRDILERCEKSHAFRSARRGNRKIRARSSGMRHGVCIPADPISSVANCQRGTMKIRPVPDVCMYVLGPERSIRGEVEKKTGLPRVFCFSSLDKNFFCFALGVRLLHSSAGRLDRQRGLHLWWQAHRACRAPKPRRCVGQPTKTAGALRAKKRVRRARRGREGRPAAGKPALGSGGANVDSA